LWQLWSRQFIHLLHLGALISGVILRRHIHGLLPWHVVVDAQSQLDHPVDTNPKVLGSSRVKPEVRRAASTNRKREELSSPPAVYHLRHRLDQQEQKYKEPTA